MYTYKKNTGLILTNGVQELTFKLSIMKNVVLLT